MQSVASHVAQGIANLEATFVSISDAQISAVVSAMLKARKVWVIGFRSSHPFARYLQWQLTQVIEDIVAIPGGGQTMGEHLVSIEKRDLVIVLGLRRRVARMDLILEQIRRQGAKLLYITDEGVPFQSGATWHFRCHSQAPGPLFNHTAVAAVCHLLATRAIEKAGSEGRARLRGIEVLNDELEEL